MSIAARGVCTLLQVFDMPASIRFYRDVLGFEVAQASEGEGDRFDWCLLRLGESELMLNTAYEGDRRPAAPDAKRVAAHRDTCLCSEPLHRRAMYPEPPHQLSDRHAVGVLLGQRSPFRDTQTGLRTRRILRDRAAHILDRPTLRT